MAMRSIGAPEWYNFIGNLGVFVCEHIEGNSELISLYLPHNLPNRIYLPLCVKSLQFLNVQRSLHCGVHGTRRYAILQAIPTCGGHHFQLLYLYLGPWPLPFCLLQGTLHLPFCLMLGPILYHLSMPSRGAPSVPYKMPSSSWGTFSLAKYNIPSFTNKLSQLDQ